MNNAPKMEERVKAMEELNEQGFITMVTAEPLMDFDLEEMVEYMERCSPKRINIGRNTSKTVTVPEPTKEKVQELYERLKSSPILQNRGTKIEFKSNANAWR
jgi:DNA repair photolyase